MKQWFYSQFGQNKGPVSSDEIIRLLEKQELELESYITEGIDKPWRRIKDIPEILDKLHTPQSIPHASEIPSNFIAEDGEVRIGNVYFYIPIKRFVVMSVVTGGLYQLYWFYKQWYYWARQHKQGHRSPDREMGWLLFPWTIMQKIETDRELNAVERADFNGALVFWMWTGFGLALYLTLSSLSWLEDSIGFFRFTILSLDVLMLLPIQRYINRVNAKLGNSYDKPSLGHYLCLGLGILTIGGTAIGMGIKALINSIGQ